ncbi:serine/threonine-protein kinase [Catenulispora yoronensis]
MQGAQWQVEGYEHIRELGRGGFGYVVLARRQTDGALVAIKYLAAGLVDDSGFREEFRREARTLAEVESPHVVRLHAYIEQPAVDGSDGPLGAAIVMDFVPGGTLGLLLKQNPEMLRTPEVALSVLKGSLLGLDAAHVRGVVHRDYKPGNVLIRQDGVSVLADFGIAVRSGELPTSALGTVAYMAPEQFRGAVSPAADVYSATAVFFECVTGHRPFRPEGTAVVADWAAAHSDQPVPLDDVPELLRSLVAKGMAKDPAERPARAGEFAEELERVALVAYGPDWERRAWQALLGAISSLAAGGLLLSLLPDAVGSIGTAGPAGPATAAPPSGPGLGHPGLAQPTGAGQPSQPTQPGQPGQPTQPGQPSQSGQPGQTGQPGQPGQPGRPRNPLRRMHTKLGTAKTTIAATAAVVVVAGSVALIPWHGSKNPDPKPVSATASVTAQQSTPSVPPSTSPRPRPRSREYWPHRCSTPATP